MRSLAAIGVVVLAGCNSVAVPATQEQAAVRRAQRELAPFSPASVATWYASGIEGGVICGELEATPLLRGQQSTLRYVYTDVGKSEYVSIEPHMATIGNNPAGQAIIAEGEAIFAHMWATGCQPYAPLTRRIAGWFSSPRDPGTPTTPITDAFAADLRKRGGGRP